MLAKNALIKAMGTRNSHPLYARLEEELLELINATGVGAQGRGGIHTALDVRVEHYPTRIAALPLAINLDCHLLRHTAIVI